MNDLAGSFTVSKLPLIRSKSSFSSSISSSNFLTKVWNSLESFELISASELSTSAFFLFE